MINNSEFPKVNVFLNCKGENINTANLACHYWLQRWIGSRMFKFLGNNVYQADPKRRFEIPDVYGYKAGIECNTIVVSDFKPLLIKKLDVKYIRGDISYKQLVERLVI